MQQVRPHLYRTSRGIFYFRIAVPRRLRSVLGKHELKRSLRTDSPTLAQTRAETLAGEARQLFLELEARMRSEETPYLNFHIINYRQAADGTVEIGEIKTDPGHAAEEAALLEAFSDQLRRAQRPTGTTSGAPTTSTDESISLEALVIAYCNERTTGDNWTDKTALENQAIFRLLIEILGVIPVAHISAASARTYKDTLQKLPRNRHKNPRYRDCSIDSILKMKPTDTMSVSTVNKNINRVSSLFRWAQRQGYIQQNPFEGIAIKRKTRVREEREAFSNADIKQLFGSEVFTGLKFKHAYYYWLPLLSLYTGARLEELCQLRLTDIRQADSVWIIDINDDGDKRLKTAASRRWVPIHAHPIELGLLDYVDCLSRSGEDRLFPELIKSRDGYGAAASKWFARYRSRNGVRSDRKSFHSFRHTFANALKQASASQADVAELLGHTHGNISFDRYGKQGEPKQLQQAIERLSFHPLLRGVRRWPPR